jgi:hypothetical protein
VPVFSRAVMVGTPSFSSARQVKICAATGARCGSIAARIRRSERHHPWPFW